MKACLALLPAFLVAATASPARADDPKDDSVTVLPWTDASFVFSSKEKRASVQFTHLYPGAHDLSLYIKASAPLDEETRIAAFASDNGLVSGFAGQLQFGWDSRAERVGRLQKQIEKLASALKTLGTVPPVATSGAQASFARSHKIPPDTSSIYKYFCGRAQLAKDTCEDPNALVEVLAQICTRELPLAATAARADAGAEIAAYCAAASSKLPEYAAHRADAKTADAAKEAAMRDLAAKQEAALGREPQPDEVEEATQKLKEASQAASAAAALVQQTAAGIIQAVSSAVAFAQVQCIDPGSMTNDACFLAAWLADFIETHDAYLVAADFVTFQHALTNAAWKIFEQIDKDKAAELLNKHGGKLEVLLQHADLIAAEIKSLMTQRALHRRDILLTGVADHEAGLGHSVALDASLQYDLLKVFESDVASKAQNQPQYQVGVGINYTAYMPFEGLSVTLRSGYERKQEAKAKKFERCVTLPSMEASVAGKQCDGSALYRNGAAPEAEDTVYARVAIAYQYMEPSDAEVLPGVELRGGVDGLLGTREANVRLTLFGTPVKDTLAARVGLALDLKYAVDREDPKDTSSRWTVTPLVFIGATLADLM